MHALERRGVSQADLRADWKLIPNWISYFRIVLSPAPAIVLLSQPNNAGVRWTAIGLFVVLSLSDGLDGFLARRYGWTSQWGKLVDPIGDKLLVAFTAAAAVGLNWSRPYGFGLTVLFWVILAREVVLTAQIRRAQTSTVPPPTVLGKLKTVVQLLLIGLLLLPAGWVDGAFPLVIVIVYALTLASWVQYYCLYGRRVHSA